MKTSQNRQIKPSRICRPSPKSRKYLYAKYMAYTQYIFMQVLILVFFSSLAPWAYKTWQATQPKITHVYERFIIIWEPLKYYEPRNIDKSLELLSRSQPIAISPRQALCVLYSSFHLYEAQKSFCLRCVLDALITEKIIIGANSSQFFSRLGLVRSRSDGGRCQNRIWYAWWEVKHRINSYVQTMFFKLQVKLNVWNFNDRFVVLACENSLL